MIKKFLDSKIALWCGVLLLALLISMLFSGCSKNNDSTYYQGMWECDSTWLTIKADSVYITDLRTDEVDIYYIECETEDDSNYFYRYTLKDALGYRQHVRVFRKGNKLSVTYWDYDPNTTYIFNKVVGK